jgi:hypothetical protein
MAPIYAAAIASVGAAALAGIVLALRRREHVPAAVALSLLACVNGARVLTYMLPHLDRPLVLGAAAIPPGLSVYVFLSPRLRRPALACVVGAWALACVLLAVFYPPPAYVALQRFYLAADLAGLAVSIACLITWGWRKDRDDISSAQTVALAFIVLDLVLLLGPSSPWRGSLFTSSFEVTQGVIFGVFSLVTIAEVLLCRSSKPS